MPRRRVYRSYNPYTAAYLTYSFQMDKKNMQRYSPFVKLLGITMLEGYQLVFRDITGEDGQATIEKAENSCVPAVLWHIPAFHEAALDNCCPFFYHRIELEVIFEEKLTLCFTYVLDESYPPALPSAEYLKTLLGRYSSFNFCPGPLLLACEETMRLILE